MITLLTLAATAVLAVIPSPTPTNDVVALNELWGKEGKVVFEKGPTGYPVAVMTCPAGTAKVSLLGGNVFSYVPTGQHEVLYTPSKLPFDQDSSHFLHGGIPVCWPWFNCFDCPGRNIHGFARNSLWAVKNVQTNDVMAEVTLVLDTDEKTKQLWPFDARVELTVRLSAYLDLYLKTTNTGSAEFGITEGLHTYLYVEDEAQTIVKGFKNCYWETFAANCDREVRFGEDEIKCTPGEGRVWGHAPFKTTLIDPLLKRQIEVSSFGKSKLILWSVEPPEDGKLPGENMDPDSYKHFFCIEPSTIPHVEAIIIPPERSHELIMSLRSIPTP